MDIEEKEATKEVLKERIEYLVGELAYAEDKIDDLERELQNAELDNGLICDYFRAADRFAQTGSATDECDMNMYRERIRKMVGV